MNKEKLSNNKILEEGSGDKSLYIHSSESEASDTEDMFKNNNLSADSSNSSRSSLLVKSIDLNDDDAI